MTVTKQDLKTKTRQELLKGERRLSFIHPKRDAEPIALVYANEYKVGMSSLGFLTIYKLLIDAGFAPERFFNDVRDRFGLPISLETGASLKSFDIVAFHFSYELDYINAVSMLLDAKLPPDRNDRKKWQGPILVAGGIAPTANPLPLVKFFDYSFIGETEGNVLYELHNIREKPEMAHEEGWFSSEDYSNYKGFYNVKHRFSPDWVSYESFSPFVTSNTTFGAMNLIEIARGCPVHCKFCLTGSLYGNVRERKIDSIIKSSLLHIDRTNRVGLIGAIPSVHSEITPILQELLRKQISPSLSSLSVTSLNERIISLLARGGMKTLTLGVESFDEELQHCYGKPIPFSKLTDAVKTALKSGFIEIKIYLMLGLPGAKRDEENMIFDKMSNLKDVVQKNSPGSRIRVSVNPFIPKITTLYETEKFMGENEFRIKMEAIRSKLARLGISVTSESHRWAYLQNLLSRGDERLGEIIYRAARHENWKKLMIQVTHDEESYLSGTVKAINKTILR